MIRRKPSAFSLGVSCATSFSCGMSMKIQIEMSEAEGQTALMIVSGLVNHMMATQSRVLADALRENEQGVMFTVSSGAPPKSDLADALKKGPIDGP